MKQSIKITTIIFSIFLLACQKETSSSIATPNKDSDSKVKAEPDKTQELISKGY
ncbi:hypothetical protein MCEZE4_00894 [Burkholderiaceae bacterium]|jgi:hypothetical protein